MVLPFVIDKGVQPVASQNLRWRWKELHHLIGEIVVAWHHNPGKGCLAENALDKQKILPRLGAQVALHLWEGHVHEVAADHAQVRAPRPAHGHRASQHIGHQAAGPFRHGGRSSQVAPQMQVSQMYDAHEHHAQSRRHTSNSGNCSPGQAKAATRLRRTRGTCYTRLRLILSQGPLCHPILCIGPHR